MLDARRELGMAIPVTFHEAKYLSHKAHLVGARKIMASIICISYFLSLWDFVTFTFILDGFIDIIRSFPTAVSASKAL